MKRRTTRRPARASRRKKKGGRLWIILIMVLVIGLGMFLAAHKREHPDSTWAEVVEEVVPETVRETMKEKLPEPVKEKIREVKKEERRELEEKKAEEKKAAEKKSREKSPATGNEPAPTPAPKKETPPEKPSSHEGEGTLAGLPAGQFSGRLAIVIDDCGYQLEPVRVLAGLPLHMSFAVIPFKPNSSAALSIILNSGHTAMLHLPMEPISGGSSESRSVRVGMTKAQIQSFTQEAIDSLPGISGVNNHQGSNATAHGPTIRAALETMKANSLFFVDSRTNAGSVAEENARSMGIPTGHNTLFLDNSSDVEDIQERIVQAVKLADRYGSIIVICHARPNTAEAWRRSCQAVLDSGITMVPVTSLLN